MLAQAIDVFLNNFKYLNSRGRRHGFRLFFNKSLTQDLERHASQMQQEMRKISANGKLSETEMAEQFYQSITKCLNNVKQARCEHGKRLRTRGSNTINMIDSEGHAYLGLWVKPYRQSEFEKQIIKALDAVKFAIDKKKIPNIYGHELADDLQKKCQLLKVMINTNKPPERYIVRGRSLD